jgi:PAS domain S-box-containing protein
MNDHDKSKDQLIDELNELRSIVNSMPAFVAKIDRSGTMQFLNHTQSGHSLEDAIGSNLYDFVYPEYHPTVKESMERVFEDAQTATYQVVGAGPNGGSSWYETQIGPIRRNGHVIGATLVSTDITKRKALERSDEIDHLDLEDQVERKTAELKESEERYRSVLEASDDFVWETAADATLTFASQRFADILGYEPQEILGKTPLEFMCPDNKEGIEKFHRIVASMRPFRHHEDILVHKNGRHVNVEISGGPILDDRGGLTGFRGLGRDITERKQAEEALRQSVEQLDAVYDSATEGIALADIESQRMVRVNDSFSQMLGYSANELLSMTVSDAHRPEDLPQMLEIFGAVAAGHRNVVEAMPLVRKDGTLIYADVTLSRVTYNSRLCLVGFFRDITERKVAQEALQYEHQALQQMLQAQDHERELIAYDIHDGVAQNLTAAMMQFQSCFRERSDRPDECQAGMSMLQKALAETRRLISGIRPPILDEAGVVPAIKHLIHDIEAQGGPEVVFRSSVSFDRLEPTLENSMFRIIQEALTNAHRHSQADQVRIELVQVDNTVSILIEDKGVGFDPRVLTNKRFGLAGIRERARVLEGWSTIEASPGKGTLVNVELPLTASRREA